MRVIGAGLGRTGTRSLKAALEQLLGGTCYHLEHAEWPVDHSVEWLTAAQGERVDWHRVFAPYVATTDIPGAAFWRELAAFYPDALVLLSHRPAAEWWESMAHIWPVYFEEPPRGWHRVICAACARIGIAADARAASIAAFERHNAAVRASVPADRLIDWQVGDGWEPICRALDVSVPDLLFPHLNARPRSAVNGEPL